MQNGITPGAPGVSVIENSVDLENAFEALITKAQLAERLSVSQSYINRVMSEEALPHFKIGRAVRFRVREVVAWLQKKETTMTNKFNSKVHQGKARVFSAVPKAPRVSRLWIWDAA